MSRKNRNKLSDQEIRDLVALQEHPGWTTFEAHINKLKHEANKLSILPASGEDAEIVFLVKFAQARVSIYNGLIGFMKETKLKAKIKEENNNG